MELSGIVLAQTGLSVNTMRFLTVAERELRAAARRKATHRTRWITAALFLGLLVWLFWAMDGATTRGANVNIFRVHLVLTFIYCLIVGTAITADCLSSERREGTLGLLFLTNLNSAEIVAGKFCSAGLSAVYGLAAIFPMLGLPMLMGGITLAHFWKSILALIITIFFAMTSGFMATTVCKRQFTAIAFALGFSILLGAGPLAAAAALQSYRPAIVWADELAALSPLYTVVSAEGVRLFAGNEYWLSVLAVGGITFFWMALITWRLARTWRDQPKARSFFKCFSIPERWRSSGSARRIGLRRRLLDINPFFWLGGRNQISSPVFLALIVAITVVCSSVLAPWLGRSFPAGTVSAMVGHVFAWFWAGLAVHLVTVYLAAMVASQRLAEDKQSGALELVLSTPTSERTIARGLWLAYGRRLFGPMLLATLVHLFFIWQCLATFAVEEFSNVPGGVTTWQMFKSAFLNQRLNGRYMEWQFGFMLRCGLLALVLLMVTWVTIGWVGRWLGLRMKHPGFAPVVALAWVFLPPTLAFSVACFLVDEFRIDQLPERQFLPFMMWVAVAIGVGHCAVISLWARWHLRVNFRTVAMSRFQPAALPPWWRISRRALNHMVRRFAAMIALLAVIVIGFYTYQNWRGQRRWDAFERKLKRQGNSLAFAPLLPGPVPDNANLVHSIVFQSLLRGTNQADAEFTQAARRVELAYPGPLNPNIILKWSSQNFVPLSPMAELLPHTNAPNQGRFNRFAFGAPITDTNRAAAGAEVIQALLPRDATMKALAEAARLPFFQTVTNHASFAVLNPAGRELQALIHTHLLFQLRASARLAVNDARAHEDVLTCLRLANLVRQESNARSLLRAQALLVASLQPLWEGMVQHQWSEPELAAFQKELGRFNFLADYTNTVALLVRAQIEAWRTRMESKPPPFTWALRHDQVETWVRARQPRAWWLEECIQLYEIGEDALKKMDVANGQFTTGFEWNDLDGMEFDSEFHSLLQQQAWLGARHESVPFSQNSVNQAIIACALERHFLAHGKYPDNLEALRPMYLEKIPPDPMRGRPMNYERLDDRRYILRSVGPNGMDDRKNPSTDDWLWSFPYPKVSLGPTPTP